MNKMQSRSHPLYVANMYPKTPPLWYSDQNIKIMIVI
ncbi:hypothetical protein PSPO01_05330 [Paraphaeosphaeria sporulosa]